MRGTSPRPFSSSRLASRSIQPVTSVSAGPPCGGLYLKPPSPGGLWEGVTTMPSAAGGWARLPPRLCVRIACEIAGVGVDLDAMAGEHLDDRAVRGLGQRMRVAAEVQRPARPLLAAIAADGRADRDDVRLREAAVERRPAMARRSERHGLGGCVLMVGVEQPLEVDEVAGLRQLSGTRVHGTNSTFRACRRTARQTRSTAPSS